MKPQDTTGPAQKTPALRKLTLRRETLRRLTPAELRLAAGGLPKISNVPCIPRSNAWTAGRTLCGK